MKHQFCLFKKEKILQNTKIFRFKHINATNEDLFCISKSVILLYLFRFIFPFSYYLCTCTCLYFHSKWVLNLTYMLFCNYLHHFHFSLKTQDYLPFFIDIEVPCYISIMHIYITTQTLTNKQTHQKPRFKQHFQNKHISYLSVYAAASLRITSSLCPPVHISRRIPCS